MLIEYLRNSRGNTSIAAFSTRARAHAPVSVPLSWDELTVQRLKNQFTVRSLPSRLRRLKSDPWGACWKARQHL